MVAWAVALVVLMAKADLPLETAIHSTTLVEAVAVALVAVLLAFLVAVPVNQAAAEAQLASCGS